MFLLGSVASLVGGVANSLVTIKADASVNVIAGATVSFGSKAKAESGAKTVAKSNAAAKKTTKVGTVKGKAPMKTINTGNTNVWKASSLLGE